jgi:hypothetical protein
MAQRPEPRTPSDVSSHGEDRAALEASIAAHDRGPLADVLGPRGLGPYRGYADMLRAVLALADRGATVKVIGRSVKREPIFAVEVGDRSRARVPTTVVLAGLHPNEWIGVETCLALLDRIASADLDGRAVLAVPVANPDGVLRVEDDLRAGRRRFVRHNAHGVDLNRNFDASWTRRGLPARLLPFLYRRGKRPASEPEVEAIAHELSGRRVDRAVSLHSFGGVVLYPRASSLWPVLDAREHRAWAKRVARAADDKPYRAMPAVLFNLGMAQGGLELDWFHERHGAISLLVECSRGGFSLRPSRLTQPFSWHNPPRVEPVAMRIAGALDAFVRGMKA